MKTTPQKDEMPVEIYIEPKCCSDRDVGQLWCPDNVWVCEHGEKSTKYLRADKAPAPSGDPDGMVLVRKSSMLEPDFESMGRKILDLTADLKTCQAMSRELHAATQQSAREVTVDELKRKYDNWDLGCALTEISADYPNGLRIVKEDE